MSLSEHDEPEHQQTAEDTFKNIYLSDSATQILMQR